MRELIDSEARVFIADGDRLARAGLVSLVRSAGHEVELCKNAGAVLDRAGAFGGPCCVVCEVWLPGEGGLALQRALRARGAPARVVFVTRMANLATIVNAMRGGAVDVLRKPVDRGDLLAAVASALARAREDAAQRKFEDELRARFATLTRREREVFALVTAGLLNKQVAYELGTSEKTVKTQRGCVVQKMGARSVADLVRLADRVAALPMPPVVDAPLGPARALTRSAEVVAARRHFASTHAGPGVGGYPSAARAEVSGVPSASGLRCSAGW